MQKTVMVYNEQNPVFSRVVRAKVAKETGWQIWLADGFQDSLELVRQKQPDVFVTELILKGEQKGDGFDLIREVRELIQDIKVVVLSELGQDSDKQKAKKAGADHYYVKSEISVKDFIGELQGFVGS